MIDLTPFQHILADAQRYKQEIVEVRQSDLHALVQKLQIVQGIEELLPRRFGYCQVSDIRAMCSGNSKSTRIKHRRHEEQMVPVYFMGKLEQSLGGLNYE